VAWTYNGAHTRRLRVCRASHGHMTDVTVVGYFDCASRELSNGFSRKMENHAAATALNYFSYNFIKIHRALRTSPAMAAGVTDRLWSIKDLVALWEAYEQRRAERVA
jgi:hypothetical protein